jgi:LysM repeat protein
MKHISRFIFVATVLVIAAILVLPVSAARLSASAVFQSGTETPTLPPSDTSTPIPPDTSTPIPPATETLAPPATETPTVLPPATATPTLLPPVTETPTVLPSATETPTMIPPATETPTVVPPATETPTMPPVTGTPMATATSTPIPPLPTATPYPTYVPTYPPPPVYTIIGYWTVQPGQTLYCIGRYYQVSPWAIAGVNYIPWPYFIYPGQVLAIPNAPWYNIPPGPVCYPGVPNVTPTPPPGVTVTPGPTMTPYPTPTPMPITCRYYHYVQWGQTLSGIAWYYGTTIQAIMYANPSITNPNLIYAGSTLCIP